MLNKRQRRHLLAAVAMLAALCLVVGILPAPAYAVTQDEINALERRKNEIAAKAEEKQAVVDELEEQQAGVLERKKALDERNAYLYEQLSLNTEQIALYDRLITEKAQEVDEARNRELDQLERYRSRVRAMEENGRSDFLSMLLKANSLGEFLSAIDDIGEIMESDKMLEDQYIAARENTERVKADYEEFKAGLEEKKKELNEEKAQLEAKIEEASDLLREIADDLEGHTEELEEIRRALEESEAELDRLNAEWEEQKRREQEALEAAQNGGSGGGGGYYNGEGLSSGNFIWPCACTYITSRVGLRIHPTTGDKKYHSGMDIGCQFGEPVWASDGGTVVFAGWGDGYGNYVKIDHGYVNGGNYSTVYAHLSSIAVSSGQTVSQKQQIGTVGSTGISTGPHLHFEIRVDNVATDFNWRFESFLTYAPDA